MTVGVPWGEAEKRDWLSKQKIQRSYQNEVVTRLQRLPPGIFTVEQYGSITYDVGEYPLYKVTAGDLRNGNDNILITGGVHGYETSGVTGSLTFLEERAESYLKDFNFAVYPCISPWGFETINRWNPKALDPNRHFKRWGQQAQECVAMMDSVESLRAGFTFSSDLHETTDSDIEFRRLLAERDGEEEPNSYIPNGFYMLADTDDPDSLFASKIIETVRKVTPIATDTIILGYRNEGGIIKAPDLKNLCMNFSKIFARDVITTEIYPENIPARESIDGQIAAIEGGLLHVRLER